MPEKKGRKRSPHKRVFPVEWHMRTPKERAIGRAIADCQSVKDLRLRLTIVEQRFAKEVP